MSLTATSSRYARRLRWASFSATSRSAGHPPCTRAESIVGTSIGEVRAGVGRSPSKRPPSETVPTPSPRSSRVIGRIRRRTNLCAPECRIASGAGTDDPVKMNCPFMPRRSISCLAVFHSSGASCHSSTRRGVSPSSSKRGSTWRAAATLGEPSSRITTDAAWWRPVCVLPDARTPSISTPPEARNADSTLRSRIRDRYIFPLFQGKSSI